MRKILIRSSLALLVLLVIADPFVAPPAHFGIDGVIAFYSWYGFGTCAALIVIAKLLGRFLKRSDDYYHE